MERVRDPLLLSLLLETERSHRGEDTKKHSRMVLSAKPINKSQYRVEDLSCGVSHVAL